jgi:hypothetical protein
MYCIASAGTDRTAIDCGSADALLVISPSELQATSPLHLDIESAVAIGGAILMLWAVAFVLRMARKSIENSSESQS